jgi:hypothetical protein
LLHAEIERRAERGDIDLLLIVRRVRGEDVHGFNCRVILEIETQPLRKNEPGRDAGELSAQLVAEGAAEIIAVFHLAARAREQVGAILAEI